jgi:hypothetical protein
MADVHLAGTAPSGATGPATFDDVQCGPVRCHDPHQEPDWASRTPGHSRDKTQGKRGIARSLSGVV